jgi:putative tryptophan/tyrosine transport system substrate-binding protein
MRRREFIAAGSAALFWPCAGATQANRKTIGLLLGGRPEDPLWQVFVGAFVQQLAQLGWIEGRNLHLEYRWAAGDVGRMRTGAEELVAVQPDAILGGTAPTLPFLLRETHTIPIVFVLVIDAIALGAVTNLARPGGNITGFTNFEPSMGGKWLELLKEIAPNIKRVGCMLNPEMDAGFASVLIGSIQGAAPSAGVEITQAKVQSDTDVEEALRALSNDGGLILLPGNFNALHRQAIAELAARYRVPAISPFDFYPNVGGLMSYGTVSEDEFRNAAIYMDRIFNGTNPGDLPVQMPTKFKLVINAKTAKSLGLIVPHSLLARADEVIE